MTATRIFPVPRARRNRRSYADPGLVAARDQDAWWDWTYVVARQMARLPAGRLVTEYRGFEAGVSVLLGDKERTEG